VINFLRADGTWAPPPGGGGGTPGGSATQLQYNNSGAFGGVGGSSVSANGSVGLGGATVTATDPVLNLSQTWNAGGVTFTGLKLNVTNTASAAGSLLYDYQLGGSSVENLDRTGQHTLYGNLRVGTNNSVIFGSSTFLAQFVSPNGTAPIMEWAQNGVAGWRIGMKPGGAVFYFDDSSDTLASPGGAIRGSNGFSGNYGFAVQSGGQFMWTSGVDPGGTPDVLLSRNGAGVLALSNDANAQGLRVYNTTDNPNAPTNYERAVVDWNTTSNVLTIGAQAGGSGTGRPVRIVGGAAKAPALFNFGVAPSTQTTNYTVVDGDQWLIFNGSGSITVTLPTASNYTGRELTLKTIAAFTVVSASSNVVPISSATAGTAILAATAGAAATLVSDGTNWITMMAH
jgi:hypothetical protein